MKLPLIAACLVAGSTWSFAFADVATSASNQKTAPRPYAAPTVAPSLGTQSKLMKPDPTTPHDMRGARQQRLQKTDAQKGAAPSQAEREKIRAAQQEIDRQSGNTNPVQSTSTQKQALIQQTQQQLMQQKTGQRGGSPVPHPLVVTAPPNDDCSAAIAIAGAGPFATDTTGATTSAEQNCSCPVSTLDIWYVWTAPATGNVVMSMCGSSYDSVIAAYAGSVCPLSCTELACNDDTCGLQSQIMFAVTAGSQYMLQVGGWNNNFGLGAFTMTIAAAPPDDDCTTPTVVVGTGAFPFDTTFATTGVDGQAEGLCLAYSTTAIAFDEWFQWVAPFTGVAKYDTCGAFLDTKIAAYPGAGCPAPGTALACNDDTVTCGGLQSEIQFPVTAGATYTLQLGMYPFFTPGGSGNFNLSQVVILPVDDCSLPLNIAGLGAFPFDTTGMTTSPQQAFCGTATNDMWFQWTAPATGNGFVDTCTSSFDTVIAIYDGGGCPINPALACNDQGICGGFFTNQSALVIPVTSGNTYTIQVGGWFGQFGPGTLNLNVLPPLPLDDCSLPGTLVGLGAFPFDTTGMTTSPQQMFCGGGASNDMWFQWVAPFSGVCTMDTCGSSYDTVIGAWDGPGCPVTGLACNDDGSCPLQSSLVFPAIGGNTYMLQVGGFFGQTGPGTLNLNVLLPPANDDCSTPSAIAGYGVFPFDNTAASTGVDGQNEGLCNIYSNMAVLNDIWFTWVAPVTEQVSFDTCGLTLIDTKIAVYAGTGCPVAGTAIGCDDDACGYPFQSRVLFNATAGASYTLQLGNYPYGGTPGAGNFEVVSAAPPANDDCSTPTVLPGVGSYPYDNSFASTGVDGQSEALCNFVGGTPILFDTWYEFTAPASGCTLVDDCGSFSHDSKISVYAGSGCPVAGTSIGCSDQSCGGQAQVRFTAVAGQTYTIQLGSWALGIPGSGTLNVSQIPAGVGQDECSAAAVVVGTGIFPYDNSAATTGCEGQDIMNCGGPIYNDIWWQWTAPTTGIGVYSTCGGLTAEDTILAAYPGPGCPAPGSVLGCSDDACGIGGGSTVVWSVTAGTTYTLQHGNWGGTPGGVGSFSLNVLLPPGPCDALDDGTTENLWSLGGNSDTVWLNRFGDIGVTTTINSIDIMYGFAPAPGNAPPNGTPTDIMLYGDGVSQDGDPSDGILLAQIPSVVSNVDTDTYVNVPLVTPVTVTGYFFAGAHEFCVGGQWVAPNDTGSFWPVRSWEFGDNSGGVANLANPGASSFPPTLMGTGPLAGFAGTFCVRVNCSFGPASYTCSPGFDVGVNSCPCSNPPTGANRGCNNKFATGGASISGSGTNSLGAANLVFTTADENPTVGSVLIQGSAFSAGINFGHGVRCAAGSVKRLYLKISAGGSITAPTGADPSIPARSAALGAPLSAGDVRYYQVYYRDTTLLLPGCPVPANQFNVTNAAVVTWQL